MLGNEIFWYEACIVFFAGIVHGILGFGFPMLATPLFALFLDLKKAVLLTLFPTIAVNFLSLKRDNSFGEIWREYRLLIVSIIGGSILGTNLLVVYYSEYYKLVLAGVILLYLNKARLKISLSHSVATYPRLMTILFGFLSGIVGGIANIMIPVLIILILELNLDKKRAIGVMSFCFITNKILQVLIFGYHGELSTNSVLVILPFVMIAISGFLIGSRLQDRIDEALYKKILNGVLWVLSLYLTYSTFYM